MFNEYDKVRIKGNGVIGEIIDKNTISGEPRYIVESDEKGVAGGWGEDDTWKLFHCSENELEKISE